MPKKQEINLKNFVKPSSVEKLVKFVTNGKIGKIDISEFVGNFSKLVKFIFGKIIFVKENGDLKEIDENLDFLSGKKNFGYFYKNGNLDKNPILNKNENLGKNGIFEKLVFFCGSENIDVLVDLILKDLKIYEDYERILCFIQPGLVDFFNSNFDIGKLVDFMYKKNGFAVNKNNYYKNTQENIRVFEKNDFDKINKKSKNNLIKIIDNKNNENNNKTSEKNIINNSSKKKKKVYLQNPSNFFRKIRPMLAKRETFEKIKLSIEKNPNFYIFQEKYDGERIIIQFSKKINKIKFFSRNSFDVTNIYAYSLANEIVEIFDQNISEIILDGEIIVFDNFLGEPAVFGKNKEIAKRDRDRVLEKEENGENYGGFFDGVFLRDLDKGTNFKNSNQDFINKEYKNDNKYLNTNYYNYEKYNTKDFENEPTKYNKNEIKNYLTKNSNKKNKKKTKNDRYELNFIIFDLIHLKLKNPQIFPNNSFQSENFFLKNKKHTIKKNKNHKLIKKQDQSKTSLYNRYQILLKILKPSKSKKIKLTKSNKIKNFKNLKKSFKKILQKNGEGIIIKNIHSFYRPNKRTKNWLKMKADYNPNFLQNLDVCIIGCYFSKIDIVTKEIKKGKMRFKEFLVGILKNRKSDKIVPICKIDNGLSKNEILDLFPFFEKFYKSVEKLTKNEKKKFFCFFKKNNFPDFVVKKNKNCVVLEIIVSEVNKVDFEGFKGFPFRLRFPRIKRIRFDKSLRDCNTVQDFYDGYGKGKYDFCEDKEIKQKDDFFKNFGKFNDFEKDKGFGNFVQKNEKDNLKNSFDKNFKETESIRDFEKKFFKNEIESQNNQIFYKNNIKNFDLNKSYNIFEKKKRN